VTPQDLRTLLDLQTRDLTLLQLKKEAGGIPGRQEERKGRLRDAVAARQAAEDQVRTCESAIKQVELEVESKTAQISKYKTQQMDAPSNEVYQTLEREIATTREVIAGLEDQELEEMSRLEEAQAGVKAAREAEQQAEAAAETDVQALEERLDTIRATFAEVKAEREQLAEMLNAEIRDRYMGMLTKKQDAVIVPIKDTSCGGCHMTLSPQILHDAHSGQKWTTCSHCGRLLYDPSIL
jgi:predicted  nucleic acid-binding Zn-ribbon protein